MNHNKLKILFVCTSNRDRSPALENYFKEVLPQHEYKSAGINKYFCEQKDTHLITASDLNWADIIFVAEDVHKKVIKTKFNGLEVSLNGIVSTVQITIPKNTELVAGSHLGDRQIEIPLTVLNCGEYKQGCIGEDYLTKAETIITEAIRQLKLIEN